MFLQFKLINFKKILITELIISCIVLLSGCAATCNNSSCTSERGVEKKQIRQNFSAEPTAVFIEETDKFKKLAINQQTLNNEQEQAAVNSVKQAGLQQLTHTAYKTDQAPITEKNKPSTAITLKQKKLLRAAAKENFAVNQGKTNIYLFRGKTFEPGIPTYIALNGKTQGNTVPNSYFKWEVSPGKYQISAFASNIEQLNFVTEAGKNYFIKQEVIIGASGPQVKLVLVDANNGKNGVLASKLLQLK